MRPPTSDRQHRYNNNVFIEEALARRMPWGQRLGLGVASVATALAVYVGTQYWQFQHSSADTKTVFIPCWFHYDRARWHYPDGARYFARASDPPLPEVAADFDSHIKYAVLAELSHCQDLKAQLGRQGFRPPWSLAPRDRRVWIELRTSTVLGVAITFTRPHEPGKPAPAVANHEQKLMQFDVSLARIQATNTGGTHPAPAPAPAPGSTTTGWRWQVRPVGGYDIDLGELVMGDAKPRQSSVQFPHPHQYGRADAAPRPYDIKFSTTFDVCLAATVATARGRVDFDHYAILGGVKLTSLAVELTADGATHTYRVLP